MKIILTMAGHGSRFSTTGNTTPKPLIMVGGRPMVEWALKSLENLEYSEIIFVLLREIEEKYGVSRMLQELIGNQVKFVFLDKVTDGQLCSVLAAYDLIETEEDLLISSADTLVVSPLGRDINCLGTSWHGLISVAKMPGTRWSFARIDENGCVVEVAEKNRISEHASTGLYYFSNGIEFVSMAQEILSRRQMTHGEYYVMPVYQKYIDRGWKVGISVANEMWDMGTPESMAAFERHVQSKKF